MGVSLLPSTQALTPGADLWIVGRPEVSTWALRLDWALNFQIMRANARIAPQRHSALDEIISKSELPISKMQKNSEASPLLIAADKLLPCRWVLCLSEFNLNQSHQLIFNLNPSQIRVFLPNSFSAQKQASEWSEQFPQVELQLVEN